MKLYYSPYSPYSQKVLFAINELGLDVEREIVDLASEEGRAAYREIYPIGKVPFLKLDDWAIPESSIIMEYLDQKHGNHTLLPADPDLNRRARFHDRIGDRYVIDPAVTMFFENRKPADARDQAKLDRQSHYFRTAMGFANGSYGKQDYTLPTGFSMADIGTFLGVSLYQQVGGSLGDWPNVAAWHARIAERPAAQKVFAEVQAAMSR